MNKEKDTAAFATSPDPSSERSNVLLRNLILSAVDGVIAADMVGRIFIFNSVAAGILGYSPQEAPRGGKAKTDRAFVIHVVYSLSAYCAKRDVGFGMSGFEGSGSSYSVIASVGSGDPASWPQPRCEPGPRGVASRGFRTPG